MPKGGGSGDLSQDTTAAHPGSHVPGSVWYYAPNKVAPPIFAAAFLLSGLVHAWQTYHYKSWRITFLLPWGSFLMVGGFVAREVGAFRIDNLGILIASVVLTVMSPPVYAGANYFILARLVYYIPWLSPWHPGRVVTTFLGLDALIEILLGSGAPRVANTDASPGERLAGEILIKVGLTAQVILFLGLFVLLGTWHNRVKSKGLLAPKLKKAVWSLFASALLIFTRCIYRVVEYFQGYHGAVLKHEAYFYVFEASLMLIVSAGLNVFHPGKYLPRSNKVYMAKDGLTEVRGPGWRDQRKWYWQVADPFDFANKMGEHKFWDEPIPVPENMAEAEHGSSGTAEAKHAGTATASGISPPKTKSQKQASWFAKHTLLGRYFAIRRGGE
ncbi:hypothetical protein B0A48_13404 [Cryoendolithus antarcticus]|uniref:RTA1 domain-containing protein n=1 Tax=Cryoendolithus antarcticus TaxID=1507870 RepID=A0A1V8SQ98_9PEZI|nr:hypothetical protein B0A48_13404 [Cryoendolithus antarcticus]